jgi:hypothetical protein
MYSSELTFDKEEPEGQQADARENWNGKFDFFFSALSYSG